MSTKKPKEQVPEPVVEELKPKSGTPKPQLQETPPNRTTKLFVST